jgi:predicted RNase H-like nuclease
MFTSSEGIKGWVLYLDALACALVGLLVALLSRALRCHYGDETDRFCVQPEDAKMEARERFGNQNGANLRTRPKVTRQ